MSKSKIAFEIVRQEQFTASDFGDGDYLSGLGGCSDYGESFGLGAWQYEFDVLVTNQGGEQKQFTVVFQPEERNNALKNYSGYDVTTAAGYGCDADESSELEVFCDDDESVIDALHDIAWEAAKKELSRLLLLLEAGEIKPFSGYGE